MSMKSRHLVVFSLMVAGVVAASLYLIYGREGHDAVSGPDQSAATGAHQSKAAPPAGGAATDKSRSPSSGVVAVSSQSLQDRILGKAPGGTIQDAETAELFAFAAAVCSQGPDPAVVNATDAAFNESRAWAAAELMDACAGFDASRFIIDVPRPRLGRVMSESGWAAAEPLAREIIGSSVIASDVSLATQVMMENGKFPYDQVMVDMRSNFGPEEIYRAQLLASQLVTCERTQACGAGSLQMLHYCARVGCPRGLTFAQAVSERTAANELRLAQAFAAWMRSQRR